jgi:multiple sugar transport system substrate-binding protein
MIDQRRGAGVGTLPGLLAFVMLVLATASTAGSAVTITLAQFKQRDRALEARLLREFEQRHPGIKVRLREMPASSDLQHQQFVTWLAARDPSVDVYAIDLIWVAEFAAAGWIRPLDAFWPARARSAFVPRLVQANSYQGRTYAVPRFTESGMLFYRKDMFRTPPRTWRALEEHAIGLQKPGLAGFVFQGKQYEGLVCNFLELLWSNNGAVMDAEGRVTLDRPEAIEALATMVGWMRDRGIAAPGVTTYVEHDSLQEFTEGRALFHRNWSYAWAVANLPPSRVRGRVGVAPLPAFPGGRSTGTLGGWNLAISSFSGQPDVAWKLIAYLTGASAQRMKAVHEGRLPTRLALYEDPEVLRANPHFKTFRDAVIHARNRPVSPVYARISAAIQLHVSRALVGAEEPAVAMRRAADAVRRVLQQMRGLEKGGIAWRS